MIEIQCDRCEETIRVEDSQAGTKIECPFCGDVNRIPTTSSAPTATPTAPAPATPQPAAAPVAAPVPADRAAAQGLPPDSGPERHVCTVKPAMFRAHPLLGLIATVIFIAGIVGAIYWEGYWPLIISALAAGFFFGWWVKKQTVRLRITNKRSILQRGLLSKSTSEVLHDHVRNIQTDQTMLGRVFRVGSVGISSAGQDGIEILVDDLPNPVKLRSIIDAYRPM
ncbi:MAG: PH domain-containing protein [Phycisphaerales bacterium]|nr:PH domain-containing protein [Phycisphaerales bacterium]